MNKEPEEEETNFGKRRVLLVEDNDLNREIAQSLLEMHGIQTDTAVNGAKAVEIYTEAPQEYYSAVLMDIRMPVMDGLEATRRIRDLEKKTGGKIPILAMTQMPLSAATGICRTSTRYLRSWATRST